MAGFRAYHPYEVAADAGEIVLDSKESHHLIKVLRAREGDTVIAFDGKGMSWPSRIQKANASATELALVSQEEAPESKPRLVLAQALLKGKTTDALVRQTMELGITGFVPLITGRTEVSLDDKKKESKLEKWRVACVEACKQSGNLRVPEICKIQKLSDWLDSLDKGPLKIVASLEGSVETFREIFSEFDSKGFPEVICLVGPEGDFTREEYVLLKDHGFRFVSLGDSVLRAETAALCLLQTARYEYSVM